MSHPLVRETACLLALGSLSLVVACGKRGDPRPPLRKTPQPLASFRIAQRADRLEISGIAPRLSTEGVALKPLTVEILRADGEGDFLKLARKRSFAVQPGEPFTEPDTLPAAGTTVRIAARAVASGKPSAMTGILTLPVQAPPTAPFELVATLSEGGVQLKWSGKRPNPLPAPVSPPPVTPPSPSPTQAAPPPPPTATTPPAGAPTTATPPELPLPKSGFWVYRRAKADRYDRPLFAEPTSDKSALDSSATAGQEWCYVVRAVVSAEPLIESASSNEACLTARDIAPPTVPSGLTLLAAQGALELRWSSSPEADLALYRVYRAGPNGAAEKIAEVPAGTAVFLDTTAARGTAYRYTITAVDGAGNESAHSAPLLGNLP
jgi:hypothetical protein